MTRKLPILVIIVAGCLMLIICLVLALTNISNVTELYNQLTGKTSYMYVTSTEVSYLSLSNNQTMATTETVSYNADGRREDTSTTYNVIHYGDQITFDHHQSWLSYSFTATESNGTITGSVLGISYTYTPASESDFENAVNALDARNTRI